MTNPGLFARRIYRFSRSGSIRSKPYLQYVDYLLRTPSRYGRAFFNLTIDLELGWSRSRQAHGATSVAESLRRGRLARRRSPDLLRLSADFEIPMTYAVVGHVAVADCDSHRQPPVFIPYWLGEDWFALDPHSHLEKNNDYYGQDLVKQIVDDPIGHEIASHGFSHVDLGDDATTLEIARFEITESSRILSGLAKKPATFVFPENHQAFLYLLKDAGFRIYRTGQNQPVQKDGFGLWQFPVGFWLSPEGVSSDEIIHLVSVAIERKVLVNFFCHLHEFESKQQLVNFFKPIFAWISENQLRGRIKASTMRSVVEAINQGVL
jgi:peptidoglycan/xylan/chitin deacetylase (PgdA/CDA1 family)